MDQRPLVTGWREGAAGRSQWARCAAEADAAPFERANLRPKPPPHAVAARRPPPPGRPPHSTPAPSTLRHLLAQGRPPLRPPRAVSRARGVPTNEFRGCRKVAFAARLYIGSLRASDAAQKTTTPPRPCSISDSVVFFAAIGTKCKYCGSAKSTTLGEPHHTPSRQACFFSVTECPASTCLARDVTRFKRRGRPPRAAPTRAPPP